MKKLSICVIASEVKQSFNRESSACWRRQDFVASLLAMTLLFPAAASANNISVSNVSFGTQNTTTHYMPVTFNLTWANAWRDSINYDAAWVFIKYSTDGGVTWNHAALGPVSGGSSTLGSGGTLNPTNFTGGTVTVGATTNVPLDVIVPTEATSGYTGAFVQITALNNISGNPSSVSGDISASTGVTLLWNYGGTGGNGVSDNTAATAIVDVMAIEMVYVPAGAFYVGDGTSSGQIGQFANEATTTPFHVTSANIISTLGGSTVGGGNLGNNNAAGMFTADDFNNTTTQSLPSAFPEGFNAFYIMKYDASQGQYRDFLNTLTRAQQANRVATTITAGTTSVTNVFVMNNTTSPLTTTYAGSVPTRNGIRVISPIPSSGPVTIGCDLGNTGTLNGSADGEWVAADQISWTDLSAYAAWSALRPMTELEFEKAARGPDSVDSGTAGEYAWGSTSHTQATSIVNNGQISETAGQAGNGLLNYGNGVAGPMRVGFAATSSTNQVQAGASYYGVIGLSGNVGKWTVSVGNATGRLFTGTNGTGVLDPTTGDATNSDWPGYSAGVVSGASGAGMRGGDWWDVYDYEPGVQLCTWDTTNLQISNRYFASTVDTVRGFNATTSGAVICNTNGTAYDYNNTDNGIRLVRTAP